MGIASVISQKVFKNIILNRYPGQEAIEILFPGRVKFLNLYNAIFWLRGIHSFFFFFFVLGFPGLCFQDTLKDTNNYIIAERTGSSFKFPLG